MVILIQKRVKHRIKKNTIGIDLKSSLDADAGCDISAEALRRLLGL
jgi:hypothetical protein